MMIPLILQLMLFSNSKCTFPMLDVSRPEFKLFCRIGVPINIVSFDQDSQSNYTVYVKVDRKIFVARGQILNCYPNVTSPATLAREIQSSGGPTSLVFDRQHFIFFCNTAVSRVVLYPSLLLGCPPTMCISLPIDSVDWAEGLFSYRTRIFKGAYYWEKLAADDGLNKENVLLRRHYAEYPTMQFTDCVLSTFDQILFVKKGGTVYYFVQHNLTYRGSGGFDVTLPTPFPLPYRPREDIRNFGACTYYRQQILFTNDTTVYEYNQEVDFHLIANISERFSPEVSNADDVAHVWKRAGLQEILVFFNGWRMTTFYVDYWNADHSYRYINTSYAFYWNHTCTGIWLSYYFDNQSHFERLYDGKTPNETGLSVTLFSKDVTEEPDTSLYLMDYLVYFSGSLIVLFWAITVVVVVRRERERKKMLARWNRQRKHERGKKTPKAFASKSLKVGPKLNIPRPPDVKIQPKISPKTAEIKPKDNRPALVPVRGPQDILTIEAVKHLDMVIVDHTNVLRIDSKILKEANVDRKELRAGDKFVRDKYGHGYLNFYRYGKGRPLLDREP